MRRILLLIALVIGASFPAGASAIVGGAPAQPGAWPWAAEIHLVAPDGFFDETRDGRPDDVFNCTGSLIGAQWVLTAAHCVQFAGEALGSPLLLPELSYKLVVGQASLADPPAEAVFTADVSDVRFIDPQAGFSLKGDLALIRLDRPSSSQAIRLPGVSTKALADELTTGGRQAELIGWGLPFADAPHVSPNLLQVDLPIQPNATCAASWPNVDYYGFILSEFDPSTMLCAGVPGKGGCFGDSGGPLMAVDARGEWLQVGITSFGGLACADDEKPTVFARTTGLFGFIVTALADDPVAPAGPPAVTSATATPSKRAATISASIDPNGLATISTIEIGLNRRYGMTVTGYAGAGSSDVPVEAVFSGLKPGKTYLYRVTATNLAGVDRTEDGRFTVPAAKTKKKR